MSETEKGRKLEQYNLQDTANVLQIRLNSDYVLKRIKEFLTGKIETVVYDKDLKPYIKEEKIAKPKANEEGVQAILNYVENIVNPQAVQGNLTFELYQNYIAEIHDGLIVNGMLNLHNWAIEEDNYQTIIDAIMVLVIPFISRLIDNKERESYAATIKALESNIVTQKTGLFK